MTFSNSTFKYSTMFTFVNGRIHFQSKKKTDPGKIDSSTRADKPKNTNR